ncbi:unnamed protein product [Sphagnum compactum]
MYAETCQWVLAKMSNLQLGKQKLEQANKTLQDALNLKAAELQELHNSNNAKDQQIKELQAEVKSNQQVQEDLWLRNHEFNKLSIELESLRKDFTDLQTKYWDDRKESNHLMKENDRLCQSHGLFIGHNRLQEYEELLLEHTLLKTQVEALKLKGGKREHWWTLVQDMVQQDIKDAIAHYRADEELY